MTFISPNKAWTWVWYSKNQWPREKTTISHEEVLGLGILSPEVPSKILRFYPITTRSCYYTTNMIFFQRSHTLNTHHNIKWLSFHWKLHICGIELKLFQLVHCAATGPTQLFLCMMFLLTLVTSIFVHAICSLTDPHTHQNRLADGMDK